MTEGHTFYTPNRGIPGMREALAAYHQRIWGREISPDRLALTQSGMSAVMLIAQALIAPGDNVVCVTPCWPNVARAMQIVGASVREVALTPSPEGWQLDPEAVFARCDARTKLIYLATPANPTGWTMSRAEGKRLLELARARGVAILSDEVYHRIVYDGTAAFSMAEIAEPEDPVFVINSFSKAWAMTGWRLGWMIYPEGLTPTFEKLIQFNFSGCPAFLQHGAMAALEEGEAFVAWFVDRCRTGREVVHRRLRTIEGVRLVPGNGSFYAMFGVDGVNNTEEFCRRAVREARIAMAPGEAFGAGAEGMIRLCFAKAPELLEAAMDRLEGFVARPR
jgi:aspartate/methionine/tyrosine aminotransferase